jgi:hypothetical protein
MSSSGSVIPPYIAHQLLLCWRATAGIKIINKREAAKTLRRGSPKTRSSGRFRLFLEARPACSFAPGFASLVPLSGVAREGGGGRSASASEARIPPPQTTGHIYEGGSGPGADIWGAAGDF